MQPPMYPHSPGISTFVIDRLLWGVLSAAKTSGSIKRQGVGLEGSHIFPPKCPGDVSPNTKIPAYLEFGQFGISVEKLCYSQSSS